jgi:uncharacterized protein YjbI with pentapeptide repeats
MVVSLKKPDYQQSVGGRQTDLRNGRFSGANLPQAVLQNQNGSGKSCR